MVTIFDYYLFIYLWVGWILPIVLEASSHILYIWGAKALKWQFEYCLQTWFYFMNVFGVISKLNFLIGEFPLGDNVMQPLKHEARAVEMLK